MIFIEAIAALSATLALYPVLVSRWGDTGTPNRRRLSLALSAALILCILTLTADIGIAVLAPEAAGIQPIRLPAVIATVALLAGAVLLTAYRPAAAPATAGVLERLPGAHIRTDRAGIIRVVSGSVEQLFGCSVNEIVGQPASAFYRSPEDRQRLLQRIKEAGGTAHIEKTRLRRRDGSTLVVDFTATLITDGSDCDGGVESLVLDSTREFELAELGRKNEERFRDFAESASDWLWETDADHRIVWLSDSFKRRSTSPPSEFIGRLFWESIGSENSGEMPIEELQRWMKAELPIRNFRYSSTGPDGRPRWRRASGRACYDSAGRFSGYRGVTSDVSATVEAEHRFQSLIEASPDMIFVHRDDRIVYVNPALVTGFAGAGPEAFLDQDTLTLCHPDEYEAVRQRRARQQMGETGPGQYRVRLIRADGSDFYGETSVSNIRWDGDLAVLVILRDVSARHALEEKLRDSEQQYRTLIELLPDAFCVQCDGAIAYANASARRMFAGDATGDLVGIPVSELLAPEAMPRSIARRELVMSGKPLGSREKMTHVRRDGSRFEAEIVSGPVVWNGRPGTITLITDISDRIAAERARQLSESRFRDFAESTSDWFWETDSGHRIVWLSDTFGERSGRNPSEILGKKLWEPIDHGGGKVSVSDQLPPLMKGHVPFRNIHFSVLRPDGQVRWRAVSGQPQFAEDGSFRGYRGATTDITLQIETEDRLRGAMKMEAIGQLTGGIAHDFNNLLAIISGNLELLAEQVEGSAVEADFIRRALRATGRGADLTQYLLAFSRQQPLSPQPTDINSLIEGMADTLLRTLGERIEIEIVLAPDNWLALADPAQTENAILNLALNARDAMPQGGRLVIETTNATLDHNDADRGEDLRPGKYLMISVTDEGVGIPPDLIDRVFEPFVTTKDVGQGSGLGLSMVYGFVKQSGGHVRIHSELGKGTVVRLYLPQAGAPGAEIPARPPQEVLETGHGETVLVVEDDQDVLNLVTILLTNLNYRVLKAADAPSALYLVDGGAKPDLLFTDLVLRGGMGGIELAAAVGERCPGVPVVLMSGYTDKSIAHQGVPDEGALLINKPFTKSGLARIIHKALNAEEDS